jgi:tetratricopeptide (TPR) repeat protein
MGDFKNAEIYYMRVLEAEKQLPDYRPEHSDNDYSCLCLVYNISRNYREAISCYKQLLEIRKDVRGINHPDYQVVLEIIGGLYFDVEEFQMAEFYYRELLTLRKKEFGRNHPIYAESLVSMGDVAVGKSITIMPLRFF